MQQQPVTQTSQQYQSQASCPSSPPEAVPAQKPENEMTMSDNDNNAEKNDNSCKKPKQTHSKVFDINLLGVTTHRATPPVLLQAASGINKGSSNNLTQESEVNESSLYE